MNSTLYSQQNRLEPSNVIKFRCRIDNSDGQDVHRNFTGVYYPRWRALYLDEMRQILNQYQVVPIFPFDVYTKEDGSHFMSDDFQVGKAFNLGRSSAARDRAAKSYVITEVDDSNLRTPTTSDVRKFLVDKKLSPSTVDLLLKIRDAFTRRAGGAMELGIKDMGRRFRNVDANGDRRVSKSEFAKCLKDVHLDISASELDAVFNAFDQNADGSVSFEEILSIVRGPMNERRKKAVADIFRKLDLDGDGNVTAQELRTRFNATEHPEVRRGELTAEQLTTAFLSVWDTRDKNGAISFAEFCDYYNGLSALVHSDDLFEAIVFSSWKVLM